jgi:hypothetical protein
MAAVVTDGVDVGGGPATKTTGGVVVCGVAGVQIGGQAVKRDAPVSFGVGGSGSASGHLLLLLLLDMAAVVTDCGWECLSTQQIHTHNYIINAKE